mmetsp:Transcript_17140/g.31757  ORF Transcript_17140/g.31757 Transcript_17140/m.31757 type:complete len:283 (+) Transcript_17140:2-850(+)
MSQRPMHGPPPEMDFRPGEIVEIWSKSCNSWCPGEVSDIFEGMVDVKFLTPHGQFYDKKVPLGHDWLRKTDLSKIDWAKVREVARLPPAPQLEAAMPEEIPPQYYNAEAQAPPGSMAYGMQQQMQPAPAPPPVNFNAGPFQPQAAASPYTAMSAPAGITYQSPSSASAMTAPTITYTATTGAPTTLTQTVNSVPYAASAAPIPSVTLSPGTMYQAPSSITTAAPITLAPGTTYSMPQSTTTTYTTSTAAPPLSTALLGSVKAAQPPKFTTTTVAAPVTLPPQ